MRATQESQGRHNNEVTLAVIAHEWQQVRDETVKWLQCPAESHDRPEKACLSSGESQRVPSGGTEAGDWPTRREVSKPLGEVSKGKKEREASDPCMAKGEQRVSINHTDTLGRVFIAAYQRLRLVQAGSSANWP